MRDQLQRLGVDLPRPLPVPRLELLVQGVEDPEVDVAAPVALLLRRRQLGDGALVDLAHPGRVAARFLEPGVVDPGVVVLGRVLHQSVVGDAAFGEDDGFDARAVPELLLERRVGLVQRLGLGARQPVQAVAVDGARAVELFEFGFVARVGDEESLVHEVGPEGFHGGAEDFAHGVGGAVFFFEARPFDPVPGLGVDRCEALEDGAGAAEFAIALFELDVGAPGCFVGLPGYPSLEDLSCAGDVAERFFHVNVLVP